MAEITGFRAVRYNRALIDTFDDVITPPFDVISPEERAELAGRSPHNYVHIILPEAPEGESKYERAAASLKDWRKQGILTRDTADSVYLLEQDFTGLDGRPYTRRGFFALTRIPEHEERTVLGHERTFAYKVEDRLALTEAVRANTGAVFVLYDDHEALLESWFAHVENREPDISARTIDNVEQRVWRINTPRPLIESFADKTLYIADGHHRYRTAWTYRDQRRRQDAPSSVQPYDYVLMGFVPLQDPGLIVYPAHRVLDAPAGFDAGRFLGDLDAWFEISDFSGDLAARVNEESSCAFGLRMKDGTSRLLRLRNIDRAAFLGADHEPAWRELDVSVLHGGILERIMGLSADAEFVYEKDPAKALAFVDSGRRDLAFILRNMKPKQICDCADGGEYMPQKATYFFPKLPSGAVINLLD